MVAVSLLCTAPRYSLPAISAQRLLALTVAGCSSVEESAVYTPDEMNRLESYKLVKVLHPSLTQLQKQMSPFLRG